MDEKKLRELIMGSGHSAGEAEQFTKLLKELSGRVTVVMQGEGADPKGSLSKLGLYFDDKADLHEGSIAMMQLFRAFRRKAGFKQFTDEDRVRRPRVDTFFEAIEGGADAIDEWGAELPPTKRPDTAWLRGSLPRIKTLRKLAVTATRFSTDAADNLAFTEREVAEALRVYYVTSVRGAAQGEVADDFEPVESYLFKPAKVGAQTAKETRSQLSDLTEKAASRGTAVAERRVQDRMVKKLQNVVDVLGDSDDEEDEEPTTPKKPRAK